MRSDCIGLALGPFGPSRPHACNSLGALASALMGIIKKNTMPLYFTCLVLTVQLLFHLISDSLWFRLVLGSVRCSVRSCRKDFLTIVALDRPFRSDIILKVTALSWLCVRKSFLFRCRTILFLNFTILSQDVF